MLQLATMTAVVQTRYGTAPEAVLSLSQIDRPEPGEGEVLVRVHAASVDRGTWHLMAGLPYPARLAFGLRTLPGHHHAGRAGERRPGVDPRVAAVEGVAL